MKLSAHIRRHPIIFSLLLLLLLLLGTRLIPIERNQSTMNRWPKADEHFLKLDGGELHYVTLGDSNNAPLLLIHGSPGSWADFSYLLKHSNLSKCFFIVMPDRPGYGQSRLNGGLSLAQQAELLRPLLDRHFSKQAGLVAGHSFGAALALQLAGSHPNKFKGVISLAGTVGAPYQRPRWYNYLMRYTPLQWLVHPALHSSNGEMWQLSHGLRSLAPSLMRYPGKVVSLQGDRDLLVDGRTANHLRELIHRGDFRLLRYRNMNHFVIWTDITAVESAIMMASDQATWPGACKAR